MTEKNCNVKYHHVHKLSNIDEVNQRADCAHCGRVSIKKIKSPKSKRGYVWHCRVRRHQGTSLGYGYRAGNCAICGKYTEQLVYDHNHKTGKLREWICKTCNWRVGYVETAHPEIMAYILKHEAE